MCRQSLFRADRGNRNCAAAQILELLPLAEAIDKLRAVCSGCGGDAAFTQRLTSEAQIEVRGQSCVAATAALGIARPSPSALRSRGALS